MQTKKTEGKIKVPPIVTILLSMLGAVTSSGVCSIVLYFIQKKDKTHIKDEGLIWKEDSEYYSNHAISKD